MKKILATLLFTGAMTGAAFAYTATGTIANWNTSNRTIGLENGQTFTVPAGLTTPMLRKGEKVIITFDRIRSRKHVTGVELAENRTPNAERSETQ